MRAESVFGINDRKLKLSNINIFGITEERDIMRLIDADKIDFNEVFKGQSDFARDTREAAKSLIDMQPSIEPAQLILNKCQGCAHDTPGVECLHCMRAYSDCYFKP